MEKGGWVTIMANRCRGGSTFGISGTQRRKRRTATPKGSQAPCQARGDDGFLGVSCLTVSRIAEGWGGTSQAAIQRFTFPIAKLLPRSRICLQHPFRPLVDHIDNEMSHRIIQPRHRL